MTRIQHNGWLYHWDAGDNPGAGTKGVDSTGLNGQWLKIDVAVLTEHNTSGTHKPGVITISNLSTNVVDNSTLQYDAGGLMVKDLGITTPKYAAQSVDAAALKQTAGSEAVITAAIRDANVTGPKLGADVVTNPKIADDAVQAENISHDNTRTKVLITLASNVTLAAGYIKMDGIAFTATLGIPIFRPCCITGWACSTPAGSVTSATAVYTTAAVDRKFVATDKLQIYHLNVTDTAKNFELRKNGASITTVAAVGPQPPVAGDYMFQIELELDD